MRKIVNYFMQGLLYIAPLAITLYILYGIFTFLDGIFIDLIEKYMDIRIPGLGFLIVILLVTSVGFIGQTILAVPVKRLVRQVFEKVPFLRIIYAALNDLFSAFVGKHKKFTKPVLVNVNSDMGLEKMGFLTESDLNILDQTEKVAVYFPHSYNFSGELFIVPASNVKPLDLEPVEVMKFIVSAGVSGFSLKEMDNAPLKRE